MSSQPLSHLATLSCLVIFLAIRAVAFLPPVARAMNGAGRHRQSASTSASTGAAAAAGGDSGLPSHLVVLVHGLAGTPEDLTYLKESLERSGGAGGILVHLARCNKGNTKDGVAEGGSRLAKEVLEVVKSTPSLSRISLVGNSLGGLYTRYAAMLLYRCDDHGEKRPSADSDKATQRDEHASDPPARTTAGPDGENAPEGAENPNFPAGKEAAAAASATRRCGSETIAGLKPSVFMTIASPHLGVRRFTYLPVPPSLHPLAGVLVGKTGSDLFLSKGDGENRARESFRFSSPRASTSTGGAPGLMDPSPAGLSATASVSGAVGESGDDSDEVLGGGFGDGGEGGVGRETSLLYNMATSEEFLRPLRAFRWRRAYANRRGDFMVPYGTAAFVEHDEDDGAAEPPENGGGRGADALGGGTGTDAFSIADHVLGARHGAIVGMSRVPPSAPRAAGDSSGGLRREEGGAMEAGRVGLLARVRTHKSRRKKKRSMEEEMAAGLNSCGWEKVSVDFGGLMPFSHNKICALSRSPLTAAIYGSGKTIVDHAADYLVSYDGKDDDEREDNF